MKSHFSEALSKLRKEKGFSQKQAAADLGVSQALLSHYENGAREPKLEFVVKACDYYNETADYLLGRLDTAQARVLPVPYECEGSSRLVDAARAVFEELEKLSDPDLYAAAVKYLVIPAETTAALINDPNAPHDPMRDVNLKLAEAALIACSRRAPRDN